MGMVVVGMVYVPTFHFKKLATNGSASRVFVEMNQHIVCVCENRKVWQIFKRTKVHLCSLWTSVI